YATPDATAAQNALAAHHIWSRIFPYSDSWIRLGLPGPAGDWARLETALKDGA
ncbi:MAG TPA: threonine-phosphate decarboxylase, partial [Sulfitobacter pontiacus]|nr:threonine-phosphate decarboxylase [Sulfitobacter pontiacus]